MGGGMAPSNYTKTLCSHSNIRFDSGDILGNLTCSYLSGDLAQTLLPRSDSAAHHLHSYQDLLLLLLPVANTMRAISLLLRQLPLLRL